MRLVLFVGLLLSSCTLIERPALGTATPSLPTATAIPSPTPIWFPPTETPTPSPQRLPTATPDMLPGLGPILFRDDFTDPTTWPDAPTDDFQNGRLILTAPAGAYQIRLHRHRSLSDFYAEVQIQINLCRPGGEYGLLVRADSASYYRLSLNCSGELRADRVLQGKRLVLQPSRISVNAPRGAPARVQVAVWAVGRQMRFFLNSHYQFTVDDPVLSSGGLGFFVRAGPDFPIAVAVSDLVVRRVLANPLPTKQP